MIKVHVKNQIQRPEFSTNYETREETGESNDGYRRSFSYTVRWRTDYRFENEKRDETGYWYDLDVHHSNDCGHSEDWTDSEKKFLQHYNDYEIFRALANKDIYLDNYPIAIKFDFKFDAYWSSTKGNTADLNLKKSSYGIPDETCRVLGFEDIKSLFKKDSPEIGRLLAMMCMSKCSLYVDAQDLHQHTESNFIDSDIYLPVIRKSDRPLSEEKVAMKSYIGYDNMNLLEDLLQGGICSPKDVTQVVMETIENKDVFFPRHIAELVIKEKGTEASDDFVRQLAKHTIYKNEDIDFFRKYCPERIHWEDVSPSEVYKEDLPYIIKYLRTSHPSYVENLKGPEWMSYFENCMKDPESERIMVENTTFLPPLRQLAFNESMGMSYENDAEWMMLHAQTISSTDILRSALQNAREHYYRLTNLCALDFDKLGIHLDIGDYDDFTKYLSEKQISNEDAMKLLIKIGLNAGVDEREIANDLFKICKSYTDLTNSTMKRMYQLTGFTPGLEWVNAEEQNAAFAERYKDRLQQRQIDTTVDFIKKHNNVAMRLKMVDSGDITEVFAPLSDDNRKIGRLKKNDERFYIIDTHRLSNKYVIDLSKLSRIKNGTLHIDVLEDDAGRIIGPKGQNIKGIIHDLQAMGYEISNIKIHAHSLEEMRAMESQITYPSGKTPVVDTSRISKTFIPSVDDIVRWGSVISLHLTCFNDMTYWTSSSRDGNGIRINEYGIPSECSFDDEKYAIRPAIRADLAGYGFEIGDKVMINERPWVVVSNNELLYLGDMGKVFFKDANSSLSEFTKRMFPNINKELSDIGEDVGDSL